jgi:hypothetical protein
VPHIAIVRSWRTIQIGDYLKLQLVNLEARAFVGGISAWTRQVA